MTATELQSKIQRKAQELPTELLQEVYEYMENIDKKRRGIVSSVNPELEKWWANLSNFSDDFLKDRNHPLLDKPEDLFE